MRSRPLQQLLQGFAATALLAVVACSTAGPPAPHPGITRLWLEYQALSSERALAIAGDPDRVWVGAAAGGSESRLEAEQGALAECRKRRAARRLQAPCRLYATGDEFVWEKR